MQSFRTLWRTSRARSRACPRTSRAYFDLAEQFAPDVVISDFESWTYLYAQEPPPAGAVDRQHADHQPLHARARDPRRARVRVSHGQGVRSSPSCRARFTTSSRRSSTRRCASRARRCARRSCGREILAAERGAGRSPARLPDVDGEHGAARAAARRPGSSAASTACAATSRRRSVEGNLRYRPFSEAGFIDDLRTARGVIAGGGFTLMGEAVYLHKPMLAVPLGGQFEQVLNARYLEAEGYGVARRRADRGAPGRVPGAHPRLRAQARPATASTATPSCWPSWTICWCRRRRRASAA